MPACVWRSVLVAPERNCRSRRPPRKARPATAPAMPRLPESSLPSVSKPPNAGFSGLGTPFLQKTLGKLHFSAVPPFTSSDPFPYHLVANIFVRLCSTWPHRRFGEHQEGERKKWQRR